MHSRWNFPSLTSIGRKLWTRLRPPDLGLSLGAKIAIAVSAVLLALYAVIVQVHARQEGRAWAHTIERSVELTAETIRSGVVPALLSGSPDEAEQALSHYVSRADILFLRIFYPQTGVTWVQSSLSRNAQATSPSVPQITVSATGPTLRWIHQAPGDTVIAVVLPLRNGPTCRGCHADGSRLLGGLEVQVDVSEQQDSFIHTRQQLHVAALVAVTMVIGVLWTLIFWLVVRPARQLVAAMAGVQRGDLEVRAVKYWEDEIGELSDSFNSMADQLQEQIRRVEILYSTALKMRESDDPEERARLGVQGIHEGLGLDRVIFLAVDAEGRNLVGHSAVGVPTGFVQTIQLPLHHNGNPVVETFNTRRPQLVAGGLWDPSMKPVRQVRCWEHHDCDQRQCPAYGQDDCLCWMVSETYCHQGPQDSLETKLAVCAECPVLREAYGDKYVVALLMLGSVQFAVAPVVCRRGVTGVMVMDNIRSRRPITDDDLSSVSVFTEHISTSVELGRLTHQLRSRVVAADEELKRQLRELSEARAFTENIIRNMGNGLIAADADGRVRVFNRAARRILRLDANEEVIGKPVTDVLTVADDENIWEELQRATGERSIVSRHLQLTGYGGVQVRVAVTATAFPQQGGVVMILEDLTEKEQLEESLRRADRMATLGQLAAGLAHEVKNPLAGVRGATEVLREELDDDDPRCEIMDDMVQQLGVLDRSINNFLRYARPQQPRFAATSAEDIIEPAYFLAVNSADSKSVEIQRHLQPGLPRLFVDAGQVQQVLLNLLLNALDAVEPERGHVELRVTASGDRQSVIIEVEDNGCGMSPETLRQLFTPYFTTKSGGTGLGLAIAQRLTDDNHGLLTVESQEGVGTTFRLVFPSHREENATEVVDPPTRLLAPGTEVPISATRSEVDADG